MKTYLIAATLIILSSALFYFPEYNTRKEKKCIVIGKQQSMGGYRRGGSFFVILKDEKKTFSLATDAKTYFLAKEGCYLTFNLRERDIRQTPNGNLFYFLLPCILLGLGISIAGAEIIYSRFKIYL